MTKIFLFYLSNSIFLAIFLSRLDSVNVSCLVSSRDFRLVTGPNRAVLKDLLDSAKLRIFTAPYQPWGSCSFEEACATFLKHFQLGTVADSTGGAAASPLQIVAQTKFLESLP